MRKGQIGLQGSANPKYKHGGKGTRLYNIWKGMRKRCFNENSSRYKWYGSKGITIADEWNSFETFRAWSLENGYAENLTLDRKESDKNYCPENCRWITIEEQIRTKKGNRYITINEETMIFDDWCKRLNITRSVIYNRAKRKNMSIEDCVVAVYSKEMLTNNKSPEGFDAEGLIKCLNALG